MNDLGRTVRNILWRWLLPFCDVHRARNAVPAYLRFLRDWRRYTGMGGERLEVADAQPCLFDRTSSTDFDAHYFYQAVWAAGCIQRSNPAVHFDVGSDVGFVGILSTTIPTVFLDIRPLKTQLPNLRSTQASVLALPFSDGSIASLSCLHVVEHIGLGRYGDTLDPYGTRRACAELMRVLAPGGDLYISTPVGEPRTCYNAHRIHSPHQMLAMFPRLQLIGFSAVLDDGTYLPSAAPSSVESCRYACGLYWLRRATAV